MSGIAPVLASKAGVSLVGEIRLNDSSNANPAAGPTWNAASRKHYRAAVRLKARAERLYDEAELEAAAELLYLAAKRTVNAVANSRARDPVNTRAKYRLLKRIARDEPEGERLLELWQAAWRLHSNADRMPEFHTPELDRDWRDALEFIARMSELLPEAPLYRHPPDCYD